MNERLKQVRQHEKINLSQEAFGKRLGVTGTAVSRIEKGNRSASEQIILAVCREFKVNETWLRTGEGEMFTPSPNGVLDELAKKHRLSRRGKIIIERFLDLKPDVQEAMADYIEKVAAAFGNAAPSVPAFAPTQPDTTEQERTVADLAAELAEMKRQNQELAAKVAAIEEDDAKRGLMDGFSTSPSESAGKFNVAEKAKI